MTPELVREIETIGSDGRTYIIQEWQPYRFVKASVIPGDTDKWVPTSFTELRTKDGFTVYCHDEENGIFGIAFSKVVLRKSTR